MNGKRLFTAITLGAGLGMAASPAVLAESNLAFGPAGAANARLDFRIIIPRFLLFRVGTAGTTVDLVDFDFVTTPPAALGDGTPLNATAGGAVSVALITNAAGAVSIGASTLGALANTGPGAGSISFTEILTTRTGDAIDPPTLADGASTAVPLAPGAASLNATWTYTYANTTVPEEGTYGGAGVGTVTYTATLP